LRPWPRIDSPGWIAACLLSLDKTAAYERLNLQPLVPQAYERGRYHRLDYSRPLDPPLSPAEAEFAERVLRQGKR
jgi:hypothetical protein